MEPKFKPKVLLLWIAGFQIIIYLIWAFVSLSWTEPFIETFNSRDGRGLYLVFLVCGTLMGGPLWAPFKFQNENIDRFDR